MMSFVINMATTSIPSCAKHNKISYSVIREDTDARHRGNSGTKFF